MKLLRPKILSDKRGIATLELALLLPFLVLMVLGIFDYSRAIHAKNIITNMSREGANLAARSGISATTAQQYMNAIAYTAEPLNMQANGEIYITVVQGVGPTGSVNSIVQTRYTWTGGGISPGSKIGGAAGSAATGLGQLSLTNGLASGETVYAVEVFYHYRSVFFTFLGFDRIMYSMAVF